MRSGPNSQLRFLDSDVILYRFPDWLNIRRNGFLTNPHTLFTLHYATRVRAVAGKNAENDADEQTGREY